MKKIKIVHILWSGGVGGTEVLATSIVQHLDPDKYDIHLCFLSGKGPIYEEALKIDNITVDLIGIKSGYDILGAMKLFIYFYKEKFDIIHSHSPEILSNMVVFFFRSPKKVLTEHVGTGVKHFFKRRRRFYKVHSNLYQYIIAISDFVKQNLVESMQMSPDKIIVIPNCIKTDKFTDSLKPAEDLMAVNQDNKRVIGFVGRMEYFKRPLLFIDIAAELLKKNNKFIFIMAGDGPEMDKCKDKINSYGISGHVKTLGFRRDIPNILKLFDALVFTSFGEGFGIAIIEAMAAGATVFAINDSAIPEIIRDEENGILLNSTDPKAIAERIIEVIENKVLTDKIKKQAMEDVHLKYSVEAYVREMEKVYERVLNE